MCENQNTIEDIITRLSSFAPDFIPESEVYQVAQFLIDTKVSVNTYLDFILNVDKPTSSNNATNVLEKSTGAVKKDRSDFIKVVTKKTTNRNKNTDGKSNQRSSPKKCSKKDEYNEIISHILNNFKTLIIMRGLPGSGKSSYAQQLCSESEKDPSLHIYSTDNYFSSTDDRYKFDPVLLPKAHTWNKMRVMRSARDGVSPIIVDNTNTQCWELEPYVRIGCSYGYYIHFLEPRTAWAKDPVICSRKSIHSINSEKILRIKDRYEWLTVDDVLKQCNLSYARNNRPPKLAKTKGKPQGELYGLRNYGHLQSDQTEHTALLGRMGILGGNGFSDLKDDVNGFWDEEPGAKSGAIENELPDPDVKEDFLGGWKEEDPVLNSEIESENISCISSSSSNKKSPELIEPFAMHDALSTSDLIDFDSLVQDNEQTFELKLGTACIKQLQSRFGSGVDMFPEGLMPVVQIPDEFAKQLFELWVKSAKEQLQTQKEHMKLLERKDEELARCLQQQFDSDSEVIYKPAEGNKEGDSFSNNEDSLYDSFRSEHKFYQSQALLHLQKRNYYHKRANEDRVGAYPYYREVAHEHHSDGYKCFYKSAANFVDMTIISQCPHIIDMHNIYITEGLAAIDIFIDKHVEELNLKNIESRKLFVIPGKGNHTNGKPKLKTAIYKRLLERNLP